jgi:hypothetical protein
VEVVSTFKMYTTVTLVKSKIPTVAMIRIPPTLQHGGAWQSAGAPEHIKYYNLSLKVFQTGFCSSDRR